MVILQVKSGDESLFLYQAKLDTKVEDVLQELVILHNGILKLKRLCLEIESLIEYGPSVPVDMQGLADEQILELKLVDKWLEEHGSTLNYIDNKCPYGRRCGRQPSGKYQEVLRKSLAEVKETYSKEQIKSNTCLERHHIIDALDILKGAVSIVYPMNLPSYDPIREELENREDLSEMQEAKKVLQPALSQLWFAGKELTYGSKLSDFMGKNEKSKVIVKLQQKGHGPPSREPRMNEEERKEFMMAQFRRREELKKLAMDDDDSFLNSDWADNQQMHRSFQGITEIKWKKH